MANKMDAEAVLDLFFGCQVGDISELVVFMPLPVGNLDDFRRLCDKVGKEFSGWVGSGFIGAAKGYPVTAICPGTGSSQVGDATLAVSYGPCKVRHEIIPQIVLELAAGIYSLDGTLA